MSLADKFSEATETTGVKQDAWLAVAIFLPAFILFSRTIFQGIQVWAGFTILVFIPGYLVARLTLKNMGDFEQGLLACFIGLGVTPLLMYYGSVLGVHAVAVWLSIAVAAVSLAWLAWNESKRKA